VQCEARIDDGLLEKGIEVTEKIEVRTGSSPVWQYKVIIRTVREGWRRHCSGSKNDTVEEKKPGEGEAKKHRARRQRTETEPATAEEQAAAFEAAVNRGELSS